MDYKILDEKAIKQFKEIYREDYGVELDDGEAAELANKFFNMMQAIFRPIPKKKQP